VLVELLDDFSGRHGHGTNYCSSSIVRLRLV
jgi:hypothetical protein